MKILLSGGAGFIGSHLAEELLALGHHVVCADDLSLGSLRNIAALNGRRGFEFVKLDLRDLKKLSALFKKNRFAAVFHLAANSDIQAGERDMERDLGRTFLTTFNLLRCMEQFGVKQLVFASSSAVYGELKVKLSEDSGPLFPISYYGAAKLASEAYITAFCRQCGAKAWIIRFPNVIGPRATHGVILDFARKLKKDPARLQVLGNGRQCKPYLFVDDLVNAMLTVWHKSGSEVNCFAVAGRERSTVAQIAAETVRQSGLSGVKVQFGKADRGWKGDVPQFNYSLKKISRLGWCAKLGSDAAVKKAVELIWEQEGRP